MAKYNVTHSCGHTASVELFGSSKDRQARIAYLEQYGLCHDCYIEQQRIDAEVQAERDGLEAVEMPYRDYKRDYPDAKTLPGTYNGSTKTIKVLLPVNR